MLLNEVPRGTEVSFQWRKWDSSPHWFHDLVFLGQDRWGTWLGQYAGSSASKPGRNLTLEWDSLMLVPADRRYVVTFNSGHPRGVEVYIDLAWDVQWNEASNSFSGIDMDLDVVRHQPSGDTEIIDQDEWLEHGLRYSYPEPVVVQLEALSRELAARVSMAAPPFDAETISAWFSLLQGRARQL